MLLTQEQKNAQRQTNYKPMQPTMWSRLTFRLLFHDYGKMVDGLMRSSHNPEQSHNQYIKTKPHTKSKLPHHQSSPLKQFF